jgi:predicted RNase H-like HicB family nuclease
VPQEFKVVIERDSDGMFVASVPALPGCHTQAPSREELMIRIREAIALHLEDQD